MTLAHAKTAKPALRGKPAVRQRARIKALLTPGGKPLGKLQPETRAKLDPTADDTRTKRYTATKAGTALRWTTEPRCCPTCDALDGTTIRPDQQFPRVAPTSERSWWNTHERPGPPAHPSCRCELRAA